VKLSVKVSAVIYFAATWAYVVLRAIPGRDGDRGVFVSMAERIAAGDTLYVDVWDNKEPLFFLTLAAGRTISPTIDVLIELIWIALSSLAIYAIVRSFKLSRLMSALVGFGGTPLILTGGVYAAGFSHLPATAILLGIVALALHNRWVLVGLLIVVLAGFKIIVVPIAILAVIPLALNQDKWQVTKKVLAGSALAAALLGLMLALRGELVGFVDLIRSNIGYSQSSISDAYDIPILKHIEPVFTQATVITVAATLAILVLTHVLVPNKHRTFRISVGASLAGALLVTAITGLWDHHGQLFYGPAALALALLFISIPATHVPRLANIALVALISILLAGMPSMRAAIDSALSGPTRFRDLSRVADSTQDLLSVAQSGTYQRLGMNTDDSHAYGLGAFTLNCYQFVQYTYDLQPTLDFIPTCLDSTDYLIVDKGFTPREGATAWNEFVEKSEIVIASDFSCSDRNWGRLCSNNSLSE
jgi:hypothetical protein